MKKERIRVDSITKNVNGDILLHNISFKVFQGEVLAVVGVNGAGKTLIVDIISGCDSASSGRIYFNEMLLNSLNHDFLHKSVFVANDTNMLVDELSIAENIFLGALGFHFVNVKKLNSKAQLILDYIDCHISPNKKVSQLNAKEKAMVQLAGVFASGVELFIVDEPSFICTHLDFAYIKMIIQKLKSRNISVMYITHNIKEALELSDRILVMHNGTSLGEFSASQNNIGALIHSIANPATFNPNNTLSSSENNRLIVQNLSGHFVSDISFSVKRGEIFGIYDPVGLYKTEVLDMIFGYSKNCSGTIIKDGHIILNRSTYHAIKNGFSYLSDLSSYPSLIPDMSVEDNISLPSMKKIKKMGFLNRKKKAVFAKALLKVAGSSVNTNLSIQQLNTGELQKIQFSKCLSTAPDILLLDNPTNHYDVANNMDFFSILESLTKRGLSIVFASSSLKDISSICNRCLYLDHGKATYIPLQNC